MPVRTPLAAAQLPHFQDKTIQVVVPFAAGGGIDVMARLFAEKAAAMLGVPVIVQNRAGASATIGGLTVNQSPPDGCTPLFVPLTHVMANGVMKSVPYGALNDFTPMARVADPAQHDGDVEQDAANHPGAKSRPPRAQIPAEWIVATSGLGSSGHVLADPIPQPVQGRT